MKERTLLETPNFRLRERKLSNGYIAFDLLTRDSGGFRKVSHDDPSDNWAFLRELGIALRGKE